MSKKKEEAKKELVDLLEEAGWKVNVRKISEENEESIIDVFADIIIDNKKRAVNLNNYLKEVGLGVRLIGGQIRIKVKTIEELRSKIKEICQKEIIIRGD